jgi:hypothetical protein
MLHRLALLVALAWVSCTPAQSRVILRSSRAMILDPVPPAIGFAADGVLVMTMPACTFVLTIKYVDRTEETRDRCVEPLADAVLTTPWGRTLRGVSDEPDVYGRATLRFAPDARAVQLDPLDRRTWKIGETWRVRHPMLEEDLAWTPTADELETFVTAIGISLGIDATRPRTSRPSS